MNGKKAQGGFYFLKRRSPVPAWLIVLLTGCIRQQLSLAQRAWSKFLPESRTQVDPLTDECGFGRQAGKTE